MSITQISGKMLDEAMEKAFMATLRSAIEERLRADIEPLIEQSLDAAMETFKAKAGVMVDMFKDERLVKILIERVPCKTNQ